MGIFDSMDAKIIIHNEVRAILSTYTKDVTENDRQFQFKCYICGDSKKNKFLRRGYVLKTKESWRYYCHNCHISMNVMFWMKSHFPEHYSNVLRQIYSNECVVEEVNFSNIKKVKDSIYNQEEEKTLRRSFVSIMEYPMAVDYCENRKIPSEIYSKWLYCPRDPVRNIYSNRMIITFRDTLDKIYYYQARAMDNADIKYLSRPGDHCSIYNIFNVDKESVVTVLEGPIDSMFVDNSIAMTGIKITSEIEELPNKRYLLDYDKTGIEKSLELLLKGEVVFNWKKFLKKYPCPTKDGKLDVNTFILQNTDGIERLSADIIEPFFTNKPFDRIYFITKVS